ncbi:hypothetical protein Trydic_g18526 [Trypoxylus dichotomus]
MCFDNFDAQALRELIHTVMELYQTKFGDTPCAVKSDFSEPVKTPKKRRTNSSAANPQPIITQNRFKLLSNNEEEAEEMEEDVVEEINEPTPAETVQPYTSGRNKSEGTTAAKLVRKQKIAPIIIKETAKWTRTANLMREKRITATKSKLINTGIQVEPATEEDYRKLRKLLKDQKTQFYTYQLKSEKKLKVVLRGITQDITDDEIKQDLQAQDYPVEKITRMKGKQGKPSPLVLVEIDRLYKSIYNITECCGLAVKIHTARGVVEIHSCYGPPGSVLSGADFRAVLGAGHPTILAGDLNCKHKSWNSKTTYTRGRQFAKIANKYDLTVEGPEEDTHIHIPTGSNDMLDIAVVKNVTTPYHLVTVNDLTSDHLPVVMTLSLEKKLAATTTHTTNWLEFEKQRDPRPIIIKRTSDIDDMVRQFEEDVKKAMAAATKVKTISHRERIPDHIKVKIFKKKILYKEYKRTLHPHTKTLLNSITNEIKEDIAELYNLQWEKKIEKLEQDQSALWKMAKALKPKSGKIPPPPPKPATANDRPAHFPG